MNCPRCHSSSTKVLESRPSDLNKRRRRECMDCEHRFATLEITLEEYRGLKYTETRFGELRLLLEDEL